MKDATSAKVGAQSVGEEIANSVSHGLGLLAACAAAPILIVNAAWHGSAADIVGASVFGATILLLYFASTLYHALPRGRSKDLFHLFDHGAIYLLIAGTYTPFTLGILRGAWGWTLFGVIWGLAILGVLLKSVGGTRFAKLSTVVYLGMGWMIVIAAKPLYELLPAWGLFWLVAGGVAYTAGVGFYAAKRLRYGHFIWHLFVIAGTTCHFFAALYYGF
jgi:hemolysin III